MSACLLLASLRGRRLGGSFTGDTVDCQLTDHPEDKLRRQSAVRAAVELPFGGGASSCRLDGYVQASNQSLFYVLVPAGHQLHVEVVNSTGSTSSQLTLY